jgi:hypothetical protein
MAEIKRDCFAYREGRKGPECSGLNALYCRTGKCRFYRDKATAETLRMLAELRAIRKGYGYYFADKMKERRMGKK